jgi:hypothetical protein
MQKLQTPITQKRSISPNVHSDARNTVDALSQLVLQITHSISSFEDENVANFADLQRKTNETNDQLRHLKRSLQVRHVNEGLTRLGCTGFGSRTR